MINPSYELVEAEAHSSFRCVHSACETFANEHPLHFHPAYELTWILRSNGVRFVGDSVETYRAGDLVLTGPNLPHCWRDDVDPAGDNGPEWIIAQFDPASFGPAFLELPEAAALRELLDEACSGLVFERSAVADIDPLFRGLVQRKGLSRLVGLIEILERLTHHARTALAAPDYLGANIVNLSLVDRLERVQRYIVDNLAGEISQIEIANQLGMSPSAFSKFFRSATGRTFMSLVKLLRINEACRLLAISDARITDIALDCGYQHTSHFDQHFREMKGMSPSDYRRRMRTLGDVRDPLGLERGQEIFR